ncbi:MAG TPA: erythromycin esterase family protein [Thermomicrobiales bacterium]|nr:erythromycin esterase family protein [Thermomicrobiales bacterium]
MNLPFKNRQDAGRHLAAELGAYADRPDVVVLGLPRGGVPVAAEVATALHAPLDAFLVRKLGVPGHEELAMGAIASGGVRVVDQRLVRELGISAATVDAVEASEQHELQRRERLYRGNRGAPAVQGKTVILVDDGLATGATMRAAVEALRRLEPAWIAGAVPVASSEMCEAMRVEVDDMICAATPEPFYAVGLWYDDFGPTSDQEVCDLLRTAQETEAKHPAAADPPAESRVAHRMLERFSPIARHANDYDALVARARDARIVLIGEASHGTHEFYQERAYITRRLITELGFDAVAVEADWPDAYRVNRYVRGQGTDSDAESALGAFHRFPRWMWRNEVVRGFVDWLREWNDARPAKEVRTGFYGLDLYSLSASIESVIGYLDKVDPEGAARARARYACFDHFGDDPQVYGYQTAHGIAEPCENEAVGQLVEMQRRASELANRDGRVARDEFFFAEQNARLARNAEAYYRSMFRGRISSWNLRDLHMAETLDALIPHLRSENGPNGGRIVVWAHNSHLGDARATEMGAQGELNLGQLARQRYGDEVLSIGFSTYTGTVTAAHDWDQPAQRRIVRPGLPGSWEALLHETGEGDFLFDIPKSGVLADELRQPRLQRAIGVIYRPETERFSHYFEVRLPDQFDALIHLDLTTALRPLDLDSGWETAEELPETFPFAV